MLLALLEMFGVSFGKDKCTNGSEFVPPLCPLRLEKILTIQVEKNGVRGNVAPEEHVDCSNFKLDTKKVKKVFLIILASVLLCAAVAVSAADLPLKK